MPDTSERGGPTGPGAWVESRLVAAVIDAFFSRFNLASFLVGEVEVSRVEARGVAEMEIKTCAYHTVAGTGAPQTRGCLWVCKGACEKVFGEDSPIVLKFEPHLPELGCSIRMEWGASKRRHRDVQGPRKALAVLEA